jgi:F-type H+-transporting ATPase subunit epsilon
VADAHGSRSGVLDVTVVSPARQLYQGEAAWVTAPAADGQLGIRPMHADLVAALGAGPLRIGLTGGQVARFAVWGGFLKVGDNRVTILVDRAVTESDVNTGAARQELDETLADLQHPKTDEEFFALLERRAWSETQLKLAGSK